MAWDSRWLLALAGCALVYASTPACSGGAFSSQGNGNAGEGGSDTAGGKSASGSSGKPGDMSTAGTSSGSGHGGQSPSGGSAGSVTNGGHAGSTTNGGGPLRNDAGEGSSGAPEPGASISTDKLVLWFKADAGVHVEGAGVSKWSDQSGNGFDATQALPDLQPKLTTTQLLPLSVLDFDGTNDLLELPALKPDLTAGLSFFAVAGRGADSTCSAIVELSNGSEVNDINVGSLGNSFQYEVQAESVPAATDAFPVGEMRLLEVLHSGDPLQPLAELRVNGSLSGSAVIQSPLDVLRASNFIGHSLYVDCQAYSGAIGEIILYSRKLDTEERASVEQYLMHKWGCCK